MGGRERDEITFPKEFLFSVNTDFRRDRSPLLAKRVITKNAQVGHGPKR